MKAHIAKNRNVIVAVSMLVAAMTGLLVFDGSTNRAFALTTPDCRVCHTGDPNYQGLYGPMMPVHHLTGGSCARCHWYGTPVQTDPNDPGFNCLSCHYVGTRVYNSLSVTAAHGPLHTMTDVPDPVACDISCHSPNVIEEHSKYPLFATPSGELDCDRCHLNTNTDPALGPISIDVLQAIMDGSSPPGGNGLVVTCDQCHTNIAGTGHASSHDNVLPNAGCDAVGCHQSNVMSEHTDRPNLNSCNTCHGNTAVIPGSGAVYSPQQVIDASAGPYNPPTTSFCIDCHGPNAGMHAAAHDQGFFMATPSTQGCSQCHARMVTLSDPNQANLVAEHLTNNGFECQTCHNQEVIDLNPTDVFNAISKGKDSNMPVYCVDCHAPTGQGEGHSQVTVEPWSECVQCHTIEIFGHPYHNMHVDAVQTALTDGSIQLNLLANTACSACHVPENSSPNCKACHSLDDSVFEPLKDSYYTPPNESLNIIGPGTEDHDKHTNALTSCSFCHVSGAPGGDPLPPPYDQCSTCHNGVPTADTYNMALTDIRFGAPGHNAHLAAANNNCSVCHTSQPDCSACHSPGHPVIPAPYSECDQCHTGLLPGQAVHEQLHIPAATLPSGYVDCTVCHNSQPNCAQCHITDDGTGHAGVHDNVGAPSIGCTQCHDANVVVEHVDNRGLTCGTCHDNPAYAAIIESGKTDDPANFVYCYDCHDLNNHHATSEAQSGNCTYCHADPRLDVAGATVPVGQLACRQCHGPNQHDKGGPIQDYGACFACHQPAPYHAKPTSWPGWYEEYQPASGRETFNLFHDEFQPSCAGDCESQLKRLNGYGEHRDPAEINDRNWNSPSVSYNMVTIFDFFTTNRQWTVPTFGTGTGTGGGGGTPPPPPPPQSDTVNITYASYSSKYDRLTVYAESSLGNSPSLSVSYNGNTYPMSWDSSDGRWEVRINASSCRDSTIEVTSSAGGSGSSSVKDCSNWSH